MLRKSARKASNKLNQYLNVILKESDGEYEQEDSPNYENSRTRSKSADSKFFTCRNCNSVFTSRQKLHQHKREDCEHLDIEQKASVVKMENGKRGFLCKKCPLIFDTVKELKNHRREHAPKEYVEHHTYSFDDSQEIYICNTCSAEFKDKEEAEKHTKAHEEVFECSICMDKFQTLFRLGSHLKVRVVSLIFLL